MLTLMGQQSVPHPIASVAFDNPLQRLYFQQTTSKSLLLPFLDDEPKFRDIYAAYILRQYIGLSRVS